VLSFRVIGFLYYCHFFRAGGWFCAAPVKVLFHEYLSPMVSLDFLALGYFCLFQLF